MAFESNSTNLVAVDTNNTSDIFLHDRLNGNTTRISVDSTGQEGDRPSLNPSISADGRFVAFESNSTNIVPGDIAVAKGSVTGSVLTTLTVAILTTTQTFLSETYLLELLPISQLTQQEIGEILALSTPQFPPRVALLPLTL
ncbi:hypothetical protein [Microcoleus sp. herbarium14]|uniref:hypothetical protein n=1 Tax=Microcoleus sp. herbarium14 TaxID=3055439 RepID=UPI002FD51A45